MKSVDGKSHLLAKALIAWKTIGFQAQVLCSPKGCKIYYEFTNFKQGVRWVNLV